MILSLQIQYQENLDLVTFFPMKYAVQCPPELWFETICSSLRLKHSILVLEAPLAEVPVLDESKRWIAGDKWCWLAPRSLSVITAAYSQNPMSYPEFIHFLRTSK